VEFYEKHGHLTIPSDHPEHIKLQAVSLAGISTQAFRNSKCYQHGSLTRTRTPIERDMPNHGRSNMWELKKFCVMSKNTSKLEPETSLLPIGCRDRKVLFGLVSWTQNVWKKLKELGVNISVTIRYNYKPDDSIMLLLRFSAFALALAKATGVLFRAAFLHSFPSTRPKRAMLGLHVALFPCSRSRSSRF
jgi:hypothetical protein